MTNPNFYKQVETLAPLAYHTPRRFLVTGATNPIGQFLSKCLIGYGTVYCIGAPGGLGAYGIFAGNDYSHPNFDWIGPIDVLAHCEINPSVEGSIELCLEAFAYCCSRFVVLDNPDLVESLQMIADHTGLDIMLCSEAELFGEVTAR